MPGIKVHAVSACLPGFFAQAVTEQIEQHDSVALGGQLARQAAAEVGVEQDAVQPHEDPVAGAVDLVVQPVLAADERAADAFHGHLLSRRPGPKAVRC